jgi:4-methylaminobutanoate oxidase (formaldehyde-forming)
MGWERASFFVPPGETVSSELTFGRPAWFDRVAAEHRAAREAVAVFDQSSFGKLRVQGRDAERLLQRLCANDLAVPPGWAVYTSMLNEQGGIESDLTVMRLADDAFLMVTGTAQPTRDTDWIRRHMAEDEHVALSDVTSAAAVLGIMGPRSRALLQELTSADLSNEAFPYFTWQDIDLGHATVRAARLSYVGELGWELYVPSDCAAYVYDLIAEAGARHGLVDAGSYALTSLRVEKAYRAWGHDVGPEDTPLEAGLGFAVRFAKSEPFIGREALTAQRDRGVEKRLVVLTLGDPEALPLGDEPILHDGTIVGQVTSAAFGHSLGRAVALGYVRLHERTAVEELIAAGGFELDVAGRRFAASASLDAPWDPKSRRLRG